MSAHHGAGVGRPDELANQSTTKNRITGTDLLGHMDLPALRALGLSDQDPGYGSNSRDENQYKRNADFDQGINEADATDSSFDGRTLSSVYA